MRMLRAVVLVILLVAAGLSVLGCGGGVTGVPETEYQALQAQYQAAEQDLADSQAQVTQLQQMLDDAQAQAQTLQAQLTEAQNNAQAGGTDYATLKQQYDNATTQIDTLNVQLNAASADYAALQDQVDSYAAQISDLQQQVAELSAPPDTTPLPLTEANIKNAVWDRINLERVQGFVSQLQPGKNIQQWADQHVLQMADAHKVTTYTDAQVGTQAAMMAIGYQSLDELVNATFTYWKISPAWFEDQVLSTGASYGGVAVLQQGVVFYISFMSSNYP